MHKNQLASLLPPNFSLHDLIAFHDYHRLASMEQNKLTIYYSRRTNSYKLELTVKCPKEKVIEHLCDVQN